jgi:hypothetical protein
VLIESNISGVGHVGVRIVLRIPQSFAHSPHSIARKEGISPFFAEQSLVEKEKNY